MRLKALTLIRPWDEPVVEGVKTFENRTWIPPEIILGQHIAIHAGKKYDREAAGEIEELFGLLPMYESDRVRAGAVVGVVKVVGYVQVKPQGIGYTFPPIDQVEADVIFQNEWLSGPYGWMLADAVSIAPVKCKGSQGLWTLPRFVDSVVRLRWDQKKKRGT